ncbi:sigma-70 family RNA polymerase sigma factor [Calothrix sp. UHCC 0171]|uniref:sigma-70 family RNA polymerase sigma factor n=1 Tax=Calothrix sp. UHCC 0171 TaxID=3110245 RepID=UPI002B21FC82|nr:sigma-70 family RNA polymerase sigma factor [Calothrix sp. UHCC 0171]MEA5574471.1 sigma-70 family RNA polymerase sigma factor [Calothrix sp. UHCC 0171]
MKGLEEQLRQLVEEACGHPPGSVPRQRLLTQIIRLVSKKLWRESTVYYQDALQQTWLYFCRNICDAYDPNRGTAITWLNVYLRHRLQDFYIKTQEENSRKAFATIQQSASGDRADIINPIDNIAAPPDPPPILDHVRLWVERDIDGDLRQTHIQGRSDVNCQVLILKRLPPEVSWKELAQEYGLTVSTLSSFYQRQCIPRLRQFAETEGYL